MFRPMPPHLRERPSYGLLDFFMNPHLEEASTGGGLIGAWGSAAGATPRAAIVGTQHTARQPPGNFHRPTTWDAEIGANVPLFVDGAGNHLHPFVAALIDQLVEIDPNSDEQITQARLGIDQALTDSPQSRNWFHKTLSDYLAGDLTPEEARAEFADRGDERLRKNRAAANLTAEAILAAEGVRQATTLPATGAQQAVRQRSAGPASEPAPLPSVSHTRDPMTEAEYHALPNEGLIDPNRIRTLQDSVSPRFKIKLGAKNAKRLKDTIDELRSGATRPDDIPAVRMTLQDGGVWSVDHRRLVAARLAGVPVRFRKAIAKSLAREIRKKSTSKDEGMSIVIKPEEGD